VGVLTDTNSGLRGGPARNSHAPQDRRQDIPHVVRRTNVTRSCRERRGPHLFIRDAVGTHDRQLRKIAVQTFHVIQQPVLYIQDHGFRMASRYVGSQLFARAGYKHRKVRAESTSQVAGYSRIFLKNNYALAHTSPGFQPVVNGGRQRSTRAAGWLGQPRLHRHLKLSNPRPEPHTIYRRAGNFSVSGSNGSA